MKNSLMRATLILSAAALLSKIIGSLFRIPLQNIAGDEVLGIFTLVYPVYMVTLTLSVAGIPLAISMLIAEAQQAGDIVRIKSIFITSSILSSLFGLTSFVVIWLFSGSLAELLGGPSARLSLIVVSVTLLVAPYMAVYRGYFQGLGNMVPTAISQVIEQFVRVAAILVIASYMATQAFEAEKITAGVMGASILGAVCSLVYLRILYVSSEKQLKVPSVNWQKLEFLKNSRKILKLSIPISIGALTLAIFNMVDSLTVPFSLQAAGTSQGDLHYLYGVYGRGLALMQIVTVFASSMVLPLVPSIVAKLAAKDLDGTKKSMEKAYFLTFTFSLAAVIILMSLAVPINIGLFTDAAGSGMLTVNLFNSFFASMTVLGTGVLQGIGKGGWSAKLVLFGALLKVAINLLLINQFGLIGAAYSTLIVYVILMLLTIFSIQKSIRFTLFSKRIFYTIMSTSITGILLLIPAQFFDYGQWTRLMALSFSGAMMAGGAVVLVLLLYGFKVIGKEQLEKMPFFSRRQL